MLNAGYPAIRFSVAVENYNHQHQDLRVENGIEFGDTIDKMDFEYLTRVVKLNVAALVALARAPMPPEPTVEGAVSTDTVIRWDPVQGAESYIVRWRGTDDSSWREAARGPFHFSLRQCRIPPCPGQHMFYSAVLKGIRVDDHVFGVSSVSADGFESPVASALPGGAFRPYTPPPPAQ
jgi:hypothetical protein